MNRILAVGLVSVLSACGGGGSVGPYVTGIQGKTLHYGQSAIINVTGKYMRSGTHAGALTQCGFD